MPAEGIDYLPKKQLLTYEEMERLLHVLAGLGIRKVRITGGEPFLRKDLVYFLRQVKAIEGIEEIHITTNGVLTEQYIPDLVQLGIKSVNLSLDTLDRERFHKITRRDEFDKGNANVPCLAGAPDSGENKRGGDGEPEHRRPGASGGANQGIPRFGSVY
jgi:molybdenum cofactor biosynthesis enzyme MoaA